LLVAQGGTPICRYLSTMILCNGLYKFIQMHL
jgi:hypothetical protein